MMNKLLSVGQPNRHAPRESRMMSGQRKPSCMRVFCFSRFTQRSPCFFNIQLCSIVFDDLQKLTERRGEAEEGALKQRSERGAKGQGKCGSDQGADGFAMVTLAALELELDEAAAAGSNDSCSIDDVAWATSVAVSVPAFNRL